jgi:hypothetical protein
MSVHELAHLELLAEVDSLVDELRIWSERAPNWPPARNCQALVRRLTDRADTLKVRLEAPLVIATMGGTGTGKSALVNALCGDELTESGRQRPTTRQPTFIARRGISPDTLGIDPTSVHVVERDLPALRDLVIIDCPDPDTTEPEESEGATNLSRLRALLPHCDVLLVTSTQQKYRSARVLEELASAAPGARLIFVQTHADIDDDVREDWQRALGDDYAIGDMFFVDSLTALADMQAGLPPRGEFARLLDLLNRELAGSAGNRVRRANFLDLVEATLRSCHDRIQAGMPAIEQLESGILEQRQRLATKLAVRMREELSGSRRQWESRLVGEIASRWGFSPFALVLRAYQGLGSLATSAVLLRVRTPAQLALWGALEGGRRVRNKQQSRQADEGVSRAATWSWDDADLRTAAIIIDGYVSEAGLPRESSQVAHTVRQARTASRHFVEQAAMQLQSLVSRLASRHTGWITRWRYELALGLMLGVLLYRLGRNFFYDTWLANQEGTHQLFQLTFFVHALFWLLLWCVILLWAFSSRLRRGLQGEIDQLTEGWAQPAAAGDVFADLDAQCRTIRRFRDDLDLISARVHSLKGRLELGPSHLGHRLS